MSKPIKRILSEVFAWANLTFPGHTVEHILRKLSEEQKELDEAVAIWLGPWSDLDGDFDPEKALSVGKQRRESLLDEIADNVIVLARLANHLGADLEEIVEKKWEVVKKRNYSPKIESESLSNDDRTIIERSSKDRQCFIFWNVGRGFYLALGDLGRTGPSIPHWTSNERFAAKFSEEEARMWLVEGVVVDEKGAKYKLSSLNAVVVKKVFGDRN